MKTRNTLYFLCFIIGLVLTFSCKKDKKSTCDIKHYIPTAYMDWLPYYTDTGDSIPNKFFKLENETYYLAPQELQFISETMDTQLWKLVYVIDKFNDETGEGCALYQEIAYTMYNWKIEQHLHIGFVYRQNGLSTINPNAYTAQLNIGSCTTDFEYGEGILGGTCYSTTFDVNDYANSSKIEHLDEFTTQFSTYQDVFLVKLNHNPQEDLTYNIYLSKHHGIVAYENKGKIWALK